MFFLEQKDATALAKNASVASTKAFWSNRDGSGGSGSKSGKLFQRQYWLSSLHQIWQVCIVSLGPSKQDRDSDIEELPCSVSDVVDALQLARAAGQFAPKPSPWIFGREIGAKMVDPSWVPQNPFPFSNGPDPTKKPVHYYEEASQNILFSLQCTTK